MHFFQFVLDLTPERKFDTDTVCGLCDKYEASVRSAFQSQVMGKMLVTRLLLLPMLLLLLGGRMTESCNVQFFRTFQKKPNSIPKPLLTLGAKRSGLKLKQVFAHSFDALCSIKFYDKLINCDANDH